MKLFLVLFMLLAMCIAVSVYAQIVEKVDDYTLRISRQVIENTELSQLINKKDGLERDVLNKQKEIEQLQTQITGIDAQIGQAKELGVKERVEGVIEGVIEAIPTAEPTEIPT